MPKLKTHKGAAKRFKKTGSGKYKCKSANTRHGFTKKPKKRRRNARGLDLLQGADVAAVAKMLGDK